MSLFTGYIEGAGAVNHADEMRRINQDLLQGGYGCVNSGDLAVTAGPTTFVTIAAGRFWLPNTSTALGGTYHITQDASSTVDDGAADGSNPRNDLVYIRVFDNIYDSSGQYLAVLGIVKGTPSSSPVDPTLPTPNCYALARIVRTAASATVTSGMLTDLRPSVITTRREQSQTYQSAPISGPPTLGTHVVGEFSVDINGVVWVCTGAGSPGVWFPAASRRVDSQILTASAGFLQTSAIPQDGNHVRIEGVFITDQGAGQVLFMQFNGDSGTDYQYVTDFMAMGGAAPSGTSSTTQGRIGTAGTVKTSNSIKVFNYSKTDTASIHKHATNIVARESDAAFGMERYAMLWSPGAAAAITTIKFVPGVGSLKAGSSIQVYVEQ